MTRNWTVAIRSYNKAEILKTHTLETLKRCNVSLDRILVFVADGEQQRIYDSVLEHQVRTVVGVKGVKEIDNFITNFFDDGQEYILMDDDISSIKFISEKGNPRSVREATELPDLFDYAFEVCRRFGCLSWSCSDVTNTLFQAPFPFCRIAPKFLIGAMSGFINDRSKKITLGSVDDFERTGIEISDKGAIVYFGRFLVKHGVSSRKEDSLSEEEAVLLERFSSIFKSAERNMRFSVGLRTCREIQRVFPRKYFDSATDWSYCFLSYNPGERKK